MKMTATDASPQVIIRPLDKSEIYFNVGVRDKILTFNNR